MLLEFQCCDHGYLLSFHTPQAYLADSNPSRILLSISVHLFWAIFTVVDVGREHRQATKLKKVCTSLFPIQGEISLHENTPTQVYIYNKTDNGQAYFKFQKSGEIYGS